MAKKLDTNQLNKKDYLALKKEMIKNHKAALRDAGQRAINPNSDKLLGSLVKASKKFTHYGEKYRGLLPSGIRLTNSKNHGRLDLAFS